MTVGMETKSRKHMVLPPDCVSHPVPSRDRIGTPGYYLSHSWGSENTYDVVMVLDVVDRRMGGRDISLYEVLTHDAQVTWVFGSSVYFLCGAKQEPLDA